MLGFFALAAPRWGASCPPPVHSMLAPPTRRMPPPGNKAKRPSHPGSALGFNFFLFFSSWARERWGRGETSILGLQKPALSSPTHHFPAPR